DLLRRLRLGAEPAAGRCAGAGEPPADSGNVRDRRSRHVPQTRNDGALKRLSRQRDESPFAPYIWNMSSHITVRDDDYVIDQNWKGYTADEHAVWDFLYRRQVGILKDRADPAMLRGLEALNLNRGGIPDFAEINVELKARTGFEVVAVPGLVPDEVFFNH